MNSSAKIEAMKIQIPQSDNPPEPINSKEKNRDMKRSEELMKTPNNQLTYEEMTRKANYIRESIGEIPSFRRVYHIKLRSQLQEVYNAMRVAVMSDDLGEEKHLGAAMRKQVFVSYLEGEIDKWTRNSRTLITEQNDLDGAQRNFVRVKAFEDVLEEFNGIYKSEETIKSKQNICYKSGEPCIHDCEGLCRESC